MGNGTFQAVYKLTVYSNMFANVYDIVNLQKCLSSTQRNSFLHI